MKNQRENLDLPLDQRDPMLQVVANKAAKAMTEYEPTLNALSPLFLVFPLSLLPIPTLVLIDLKISKNVTENKITATKTYGVTIT